MLVFRGLMLAVLDGQSVGPFPVEFNRLSSGFLPEFLPMTAGVRLSSLLLGVFVGARAGVEQQPDPVAAGAARA